MQRLGIFVGENNNSSFFREISKDLAARYRVEFFTKRTYDTPLLNGRLNRWAFHRGIRVLLRRSDIGFFEWASELLVPASHMPKSCAIVTRLHSFELYAWAPKVNWNRVDKVILVSEAMRQKFCRLYPSHAAKTEVVHNGCSLERFTPPRQREFRFNLGMLGSLYPRKRVYEMVLTLWELKQRGYRPHLHVAGGVVHGPDLDEYFVALLRLIEKLGLRDDVTHYDHVSDPSGWLQRMDIFISNSYWEGHQVALIEAMAAGCHCLSHFWDGAEEVLPTENLYATDAQLQRMILEYCSLPDHEKRDRQARMRAIAVEKFDIEATKSRIRAILHDIGGQG